MRAVMNNVSEHFLEDRRRRNGDRGDEMWDGVLHMNPNPSREHQDFASALEAWLRDHWARPHGNRVHREINLCGPGGWPDNYRIPDLVLVSPDRFHIDHDTYFEEPPLVVVEIHSPGDEAYEKLEFYAELGVPEAWIIHRDTRKPEVFVLRRGAYRLAAPDADGWMNSPATSVRMKPRRPKKLAVQRGADADTLRNLPE